MAILIADSGATKCEWCFVDDNNRKKILNTQGISPYFLTTAQIQNILTTELLPGIKNKIPDVVHYYGTGCARPENAKLVQSAIKNVFPKAKVNVTHDLMAAARGLCGHSKGIASNLGTGCFSCYYDGKKIVKTSPGLGYALGDEGSGAYLGKKVLQYYLYKTFDDELRYKFDLKYNTNSAEILENVYKKPMPNRYLASYTMFLVENRGHYMIENIIEDGLNDFFFTHLCKFAEIWKHPVNFTGSISVGFKDVITELCQSYEFELGKVVKSPMEGLIKYHSA